MPTWSKLSPPGYRQLTLICTTPGATLVPWSDKRLSINGDFFNRSHPIVYLIFNKMVLFCLKKWSCYRPGVAQRVGRGIALLFHEHGTRRGWVVSSTPRPHFTPGKDPVPIFYTALARLQYISFLPTCFSVYKTIFRPMLNTERHIQCVHTLCDPIVFAQNCNNQENSLLKTQVSYF